MAVNDTVQLAVKGVVSFEDHVHTQHFRYMDLACTEQGLIDAWQATAQTAYRGLFSTNDTAAIQLLTASQVCGSLPLRAPTEESVSGASAAGSRAVATTGLPAWMAAIVSERTASAGRSRRGRFFIGGIYEGDYTFDALTPAYLAALQAYIDALMGAFGSGGTNDIYRLVVHSRLLASVPGSQCQNSSTLITGMLARAQMGTMKSRKPGSGT